MFISNVLSFYWEDKMYLEGENGTANDREFKCLINVTCITSIRLTVSLLNLKNNFYNTIYQ